MESYLAIVAKQKKWVKDINAALKEWITQGIQSILERLMQHERIHAWLELSPSGDTLLLKYPILKSGTRYITTIVWCNLVITKLTD